MFKRILCIAVLLMFFCQGNCFGASAWTKGHPAGTDSASDIDYWCADQNNESLDRLLSNYRRNCIVEWVSTSSVSIAIGEVVCSNTAGTTRVFRANTAATTLTSADIVGGGGFGNNTTYYVYAVADTDATTFTGSISTSSASAGTYFKKLSTFTTNSTGEIVNDAEFYNYSNVYGLAMGTWVSKTVDTAYQASSDGFVVTYNDDSTGSLVTVYSDTSNPPTTVVGKDGNTTSPHESSICIPIKSGNYYKVSNANHIWWVPMGYEN